MTDKIAEYKKRRAARILARLDAKGDNDEGRWVTTENDNRVHLNKNGVPDKGNPFVVAAMTGKKPKLSMNYHQKNVAKAIKSGKSYDVEEALEKLPNGSKILLNGQKYKAEFFNNEFVGGRGVEFVNEEDQDDILQSYEVTDELLNNGDVSLEAPDRKSETESTQEAENVYEPDIEPEEENISDIFEESLNSIFDPDNDKKSDEPDDLPGDTGYGETATQEAASSESSNGLKSIMMKQGSEDVTDSEYKAGYNEAISQLTNLKDGTQVKIGNKTYTKIDDEIYPFKIEGTNQTVTPDSVYYALEEAAIDADLGGEDFDMEIIDGPDGESEGEITFGGESLFKGKTEQETDLTNSLKDATGKLDKSNVYMLSESQIAPVIDIIDQVPNGTVISCNDTWNFKKDENGHWVDADEETGGTKDPEFVAKMLTKYGVAHTNLPDTSAKSYAEMTPTEQHKKDLLDALDTFKHKNKESDIVSALDSLEDGDVITVGKHKFTKHKDPKGSFYDTYTDENGTVSGNHSVKLALKEAVYLDLPVDLHGTDLNAGEYANFPDNVSTTVQSDPEFEQTKTALNNLIDEINGPGGDSVTNFKINNTLNLLNDGESIKIGDQIYTKNSSNLSYPWKGKDGIATKPIKVVKDFMNASKSGENIEYLPASSNPQTAFSGIKANGSGAIQDVKSGIDDFINKVKNKDQVSTYQLGKSFETLENGSTIKIGNTTYIKSTDEYGDAEFKFTDKWGDNDWKSASGIADKIYDVANIYDNPKIELNEPSPQYKQKQASMGSAAEQASYENISKDMTKSALSSAGETTDITFNASDFTATKKNKAVWDKGKGTKIDNLLRPVTGAVWKTLTPEAKHSLWAYTDGSYDDMNETLREGKYNGDDNQKEIDEVTAAIDQCSSPSDVWLQRGISYHSLGKLFGISDNEMDSYRGMGAKFLLDALQNSANYGQDKAFMSCGSAKGKGFSHKEVILNIYCPKGTKMMYAEPFSNYGASGAHEGWDGESKQTHFSGEHETLLQRGTMLVPRKVSMSGGKIYVDVDVIGQEYKNS